MINEHYYSSYTPSNTDPETLEKMFVQRHKLLERSVDWCAESILSDKKNHLLLIGPRGSGKTHLISMIVNRLRQQQKLQKKMVVVWLGEDDVISSLVDLMLLILENLAQENPDRFNKKCLEQAKGQPANMVAEIIMHSINEQIGKNTILLVKENINQVFSGLKDDGKKKFRAFLQENNNLSILATSQLLFSGVSSRNSAFYGFFDTHHLKPLSVDDAKQLISNIASLNNDQHLVEFLNTAQGCYRLRALHHLAGGNHRLYIELSMFLSTESLDNFVTALTRLADELTPYFQERINSLSTQQARIVQKLCSLKGATAVKAIAEETFIDERSVAKQLGDLSKQGYVISHRRGKQSFYEMAEPLMRLALEIKKNQGKPLKIITSLLRAWFSDAELKRSHQENTSLLNSYKTAALSSDKEFLVSINSSIEKQIMSAVLSKDNKQIIASCSEIIEGPLTEGEPLTQRANALLKRGTAFYLNKQLKKALNDLNESIEITDAHSKRMTKLLYIRSATLNEMGKDELGLKDLNTLIEMKAAPSDLIADALFNRSITHRNMSKDELEMKDLNTLIEMDGAASESIAKALFNRSVTHSEMDNDELELKDLNTLIEMDEAPAYQIAKALLNRSVAHSERGNDELGLKDLNALIEMKDVPSDLMAEALLNRSVTHRKISNDELELKDLNTLIEMDEAPADLISKALYNRSVTNSKRGNNELELKDLNTLIEMDEAPADHIAKALFSRSITYHNIGDSVLTLNDLNSIINMDDCPSNISNYASFFKPEIYYQSSDIKQAQSALKAAFSSADQGADSFPCNDKDILVSILQLGSAFWLDQLQLITSLYADNNVLANLGSAIIHSISSFVEDEALMSSFKKWQSLWTDIAEPYEELEIPIQVLQVTLSVMEQKNDKPLLSLAKEVRELVQPLLQPLLD